MNASIRSIVKIPLKGSRISEFISFHNLPASAEHIAIGLGDWRKMPVPLVRIHSECLTGDIFGSLKCDCGPQLDEAMEFISASGGVILYLRQEGRGIGLYNKLDAYQLQEAGLDTFEANRALNFPSDMRDFSVAANILRALGIFRIRLLSNNPEKAAALSAAGLEVVEQVQTGLFQNQHNGRYLSAKRDKAGHRLNIAKGS